MAPGQALSVREASRQGSVKTTKLYQSLNHLRQIYTGFFIGKQHLNASVLENKTL